MRAAMFVLLAVPLGVASGVGRLAVDDGEFLIDTSGTRERKSPASAFDGTNYLTVWEDCRNDPDRSDIYGARVSQSGAVLDPSGLAISRAADRQRYPALAFGNGDHLVAWEDYRSNPNYPRIYGARVSQAGTVLDPSGILIQSAAMYLSSPAVSHDGTNYLVVWQDFGRGAGYDIYGARVSSLHRVMRQRRPPGPVQVCSPPRRPALLAVPSS